MAEQASPHYPVMLPDVLQAMKPAAGEVYVDGTMGAGGYTKAMMDEAGFEQTDYQNMTGGIVALHRGFKF